MLPTSAKDALLIPAQDTILVFDGSSSTR